MICTNRQWLSRCLLQSPATRRGNPLVLLSRRQRWESTSSSSLHTTTVPDHTTTNHNNPSELFQTVRLTDQVEEILSFHDTQGHDAVRKRWIQEVSFQRKRVQQTTAIHISPLGTTADLEFDHEEDKNKGADDAPFAVFDTAFQSGPENYRRTNDFMHAAEVASCSSNVTMPEPQPEEDVLSSWSPSKSIEETMGLAPLESPEVESDIGTNTDLIPTAKDRETKMLSHKEFPSPEDNNLPKSDDFSESPWRSEHTSALGTVPHHRELLEQPRTQDSLNEDQERRNALHQAIALLRSMRASEWKTFDLDPSLDYVGKDDDSIARAADTDIRENDTVSSPHDVEIIEIDDDDYYYDDARPKLTEGEDEDATENESDDNFVDFLLATDFNALDTVDINLLMARLALSSELAHEDIVQLLITKLSEIQKSSSPPDATTYEILLLSLIKRFHQPEAACQLADRMDRSLEEWTPECLTAAIEAFQSRGRFDRAEALLQNILDDYHRSFKIQNRVFHLLLQMASQRDREDDIIELMRRCLQETRRRYDPHAESVVIQALYYSPKEGRSAAFLERVMVLLKQRQSILIPGEKVWKHFIKVASRRNRLNNDTTLAVLTRQAFDQLNKSNPSYRPDPKLLTCGLNVSQELGDSKFATDLVMRVLNHTPARIHTKSSLSVPSILKAVEICVEHGDAENGRLIVERCGTFGNLPAPLMQKMYSLVLDGYSLRGDTMEAQGILYRMVEANLPLSEDNLSSTMQAFALAKDHAGARTFLDAIEDGKLHASYDSSIYGGFILSSVRSSEWRDALSAFETMKEKDLPTMASTSYCLILAADKINGRSEVELVLEDILEHGGSIDQNCCLFSCSLLLPELHAIKSPTVTTIRGAIRGLCQNETLANPGLDLVRKMRVAELTDQRSSTIAGENASESWRCALRSLLNFAKALRRVENQ